MESARRTPSRWRRCLRVSVSGLMSIVLLIGGGTGWLVRRAHTQRNAVAAIQAAGGQVIYDFQYDHVVFNADGKPKAPRWLVDLVGVDHFAEVLAVRLRMPPKDAGAMLALVGRLTSIECLTVTDPKFGDAELLKLKTLTEVRHLNLKGTAVTDAGLKHINGMTKLKTVVLLRTLVTENGAGRLRGTFPVAMIEWDAPRAP
jgi:hypothetical protein